MYASRGELYVPPMSEHEDPEQYDAAYNNWLNSRQDYKKAHESDEEFTRKFYKEHVLKLNQDEKLTATAKKEQIYELWKSQYAQIPLPKYTGQ